MSFGTIVNPAAIQEGDSIATKYNPHTLEIVKSRKVRRVAFCSKPECVHLDHECYDTRFSTVVKA